MVKNPLGALRVQSPPPEQIRGLGLKDSRDKALVPSSGNHAALQTLGP